MELCTLTQVERLQLINQYKLLEKMDPENEKQYVELRKILEEGITVFYEKVFEDIYPEIGLERCYFVKKVADMFLELQYSFKKLDDKSGLDERNVLFYGFHVHDRDERRYMEFLKRTVGEPDPIWPAILRILEAGPDSNQTVRRDHYTKMVERWIVIKQKYEGKEKWKLTKEEIRAIIADDNVPKM